MRTIYPKINLQTNIGWTAETTSKLKYKEQLTYASNNHKNKRSKA